MKRLIVLFALMPMLSFGQTSKYTKPIALFGTGYVIGTTTNLLLTARGMPQYKVIPISIGVATAFEAGREMYDKFGKGLDFDVNDVAGTFVGALVGNITIAVYFGDFKVKKFKKYRL